MRKKKPKKGHSVDSWTDLSRSIGMLLQRGRATLPLPARADEIFSRKMKAPANDAPLVLVKWDAYAKWVLERVVGPGGPAPP